MSICTPYRPLARAKRDGRMSGGGVQTEYGAFGLSWMRSRYLRIVGSVCASLYNHRTHHCQHKNTPTRNTPTMSSAMISVQ